MEPSRTARRLLTLMAGAVALAAVCAGAVPSLNGSDRAVSASGFRRVVVRQHRVDDPGSPSEFSSPNWRVRWLSARCGSGEVAVGGGYWGKTGPGKGYAGPEGE